MSREWQQTKLRKYVVPDAVYYQCLWAVRDLYRMENRLDELEQNRSFMVCEDQQGIMTYDSTVKSDDERQILERRIGEIQTALEMIPAKYRIYILRNIIFHETGKDYPAGWKIWKQKFLFYVAKNLSLIS